MAIDLTFIVNGEEVPVKAEADSPIEVARWRALKLSYNTGREESEWETRVNTGMLVPDGTDCGSLVGGWLFLTLRVGCGGCALLA